jgi:hypothetical protein
MFHVEHHSNGGGAELFHVEHFHKILPFAQEFVVESGARSGVVSVLPADSL